MKRTRESLVQENATLMSEIESMRARLDEILAREALRGRPAEEEEKEDEEEDDEREDDDFEDDDEDEDDDEEYEDDEDEDDR